MKNTKFTYEDAVRISKENKLSRTCVSLQGWVRKDSNRPSGARNMYEVIRETEKAIFVQPIDVMKNIKNIILY